MRQSGGWDTNGVIEKGLAQSVCAPLFYAIGLIDRRKYSLKKIEKSFDSLSPKRKLAYQVSGAAMVAAPAALAFIGIIWCSLFFYRKKLKQPLELLAGATDKIMEQDLDFKLAYDCADEMGALCQSFEKMRQVLYENNRKMWEMLEERRLLQASVAHDLRNPIAITKGYAEYLYTGMQRGGLDREKTCRIAKNLTMAAKRLEQYTDSVRQLNQLEEIKLNKKQVPVIKMAETVTEDLCLLAEQEGIVLKVVNHLPDCEIQIDFAVLCRILENIMSNALRFAKTQIILTFSMSGHILSITVEDDGEGFGPWFKEKKKKAFLAHGTDGHLGIGLAVSRILCQMRGRRRFPHIRKYSQSSWERARKKKQTLLKNRRKKWTVCCLCGIFLLCRDFIIQWETRLLSRRCKIIRESLRLITVCTSPVNI